MQVTLDQVGDAGLVVSGGLQSPGITPELMVTRHYAQRDYPFIFTHGVQASYVEVDLDTGFVKLLKHWAVEDCGRVINPKLVEEQRRGAIVQGFGGAMYEECLYDTEGPLRKGSLADDAWGSSLPRRPEATTAPVRGLSGRWRARAWEPRREPGTAARPSAHSPGPWPWSASRSSGSGRSCPHA